MNNLRIFSWIKTGTLQKHILLMGILALLIFPPLVSGGTSGTAVIIGNIFHSPVALFTANIIEGPAPLVVQFTDQSDSDPQSWNWDFGDGSNSTDRNPRHTYANGIYSVNLTVSNGAGPSTKNADTYIIAYASKNTLTYGNTMGLTGTDVALFNISEFTSFGGTHSLSGNTLILTYPAGSAFHQMTINMDSVDDSKGNISGSVKSILLKSIPITGTLPSTGESEKHTLVLHLNAVPPTGAEIHTTIIDGVDRESQKKFQTIASANGLLLLDTMYELVVSTNIPSSYITSAEIIMEVPASWYNTYGLKTVRMMRIDNAGSVSILDTSFSGFAGPNAIYTGRSPSGLSTFAITALQGSTTSSQSPSSTDSGSSSGDGGIPAGSKVAEKGPGQPDKENPPVQVPVQDQKPVISGGQGYQLAPAQGSLVSQTIDLSPYSQFMYTDSFGRPCANINRVVAERTGATLSVSGKTVRIIRSGFTLSITAESMTEVNGVILVNTIKSILIATTPIEARMDDVGPVTSSFTAGLSSLPPASGFVTTIAEPVNPVVAETFRRTIVNEGDEVQAIAYTLTVQKTNIISTLPATLKMSAPVEWVNAHGGIHSIVIGRISDDQTCTILKTSFLGYDRNGNMEFGANSPDGLSVFGLIATKGSLQTRIGLSEFMIPGTIGGLAVMILILLIIGGITGCIIWRKRITRTKIPDKGNKK
ncbi:MAG: PKD domain-containing protein [Methanoregula sp.]